jgi:flagellar biosynthesis/type III secretory pathway chaperone
MEHVKIKTGQSMGLEMSQMGYYPQQIKEANLTNPSYPEFGSGKKINSAKEVRQKLQALMNDNGINGRMIPVKRYNNDNRVNVSAGIR